MRRLLLERLTPEVLNPFARTPENEAQLRSALAAICADPELDLADQPRRSSPRSKPRSAASVPLQPLVDDPEVADILVNAPDAVFVERAGRLRAEPTCGWPARAS